MFSTIARNVFCRRSETLRRSVGNESAAIGLTRNRTSWQPARFPTLSSRAHMHTSTGMPQPVAPQPVAPCGVTEHCAHRRNRVRVRPEPRSADATRFVLPAGRQWSALLESQRRCAHRRNRVRERVRVRVRPEPRSADGLHPIRVPGGRRWSALLESQRRCAHRRNRERVRVRVRPEPRSADGLHLIRVPGGTTVVGSRGFTETFAQIVGIGNGDARERSSVM